MAGWITINGTHIYVKEGESVEQAFSRTTGASLQGKYNPNQTENAKPFRINDALKKVYKEKDKKVHDKFLKSIDEKDEKSMIIANEQENQLLDEYNDAKDKLDKVKKVNDKENAKKEKEREINKKINESLMHGDKEGAHEYEKELYKMTFGEDMPEKSDATENQEKTKSSRQKAEEKIKESANTTGYQKATGALKDYVDRNKSLMESIVRSGDHFYETHSWNAVRNFVYNVPDVKNEVINQVKDYYQDSINQWTKDGDEDMVDFVKNDMKLCIKQINSPEKLVDMDSDPRDTLRDIMGDVIAKYYGINKKK